MATLKELYTTLKSLRDMNLPVDDKLLKAADNLEEKIIKEEILPALSQNIEPQLSEIQRDLVLVVEYHPGEPLSVALSRKTKISETFFRREKDRAYYAKWQDGSRGYFSRRNGGCRQTCKGGICRYYSIHWSDEGEGIGVNNVQGPSGV